MKRIEQLIRPELLKLLPYSSARDEFLGEADVYIDANENPYGGLMNRYPDPLQRKLKARISELKEVSEECIFIGNGSDEALDLIFRLFCVPGQDNIIVTPPTYGMYKVLAGVNNIFAKEVHLSADFQLDIASVLKVYNRQTKILFLCSPNNPVGNSLLKDDVLRIIDDFPGIVVIDEAYIDFTNVSGYLDLIEEKPNLIITQTLSKAWGMAGIRLGMAFANPFIISYLNKIKPPYNINVLTQEAALKGLSHEDVFQANLVAIIEEKTKLANSLLNLPMVRKIHKSDTNFLLVEFDDADRYYTFLVQRGIIVRNRSKQLHCENCLRITIGTPEENQKLIDNLKT